MATTGTERRKPWEERLLAELWALDPVPGEVVVAAKATFRWRRVEGSQLAELVHDSAGVAGRRLSFEAPGLGVGIEVEVDAVESGERPRVVGQVVPPQPAHIEVRAPQDSREVDADDRGRFTVGDMAPGPFRLGFRLVDPHVAVETAWVTI